MSVVGRGENNSKYRENLSDTLFLKYKIFPTHRLVEWKYPFKEQNEINLAFGTAFDHAISQLTYYKSRTFFGRGLIMKAFRHFLFEFHHLTQLSHQEREPYVIRAWKMLNAFATTPIYQRELLRDRTRVIIIDEERTGMFAQPDFVDHYEKIIYEVKTFELKNEDLERSIYQVKLFQLAYPDYKAVLVGFMENNERIEPQYVHMKVLSKNEAKKLLHDIMNYAKSHNTEELSKYEIIYNRVHVHYGHKNYRHKKTTQRSISN
jgi:hypothetical protein